MHPKPDYNNIQQWLDPILYEKQISVEQLARAAGLSRASLYNYMIDRYRPDEQHMAKLCRVLGVPLEEGLRQYTPRRRGRPRGLGNRLTSVISR